MRVGAPGTLRRMEDLFVEGSLVGLTDEQLLHRFTERRSEAAFAVLVERHGPMVLGVCRGALRNEHDAEDAFQATFLVLARKAASLWVRGSLGGWLHRVAVRIAVESSRSRARRVVLEKAGARPDCTDPSTSSVPSELIAALHEEIERLPEKYREPVVLCELQALTRDQAASRLGWPPGTVAGRLARARDLLRDRMLRRGLIGPCLGLAGLAIPRTAPAAVPSAWAADVVLAAMNIAGPGTVPATSAPAGVTGLAERAMGAMVHSSIRIRTIGLLAAGLAAGALMLAVSLASARQEPTSPKVTIAGTVNGPDGKPAMGVRVFYSTRGGSGWGKVLAEAEVDTNGRFNLPLPLEPRGSQGNRWAALWAYRPGSLIAVISMRPDAQPRGLPVRFNVGPPSLSLFEVRASDGKPVPNATITPRVLSRHSLSLPDGLAERIAAETRTDAEGRAVLTALLPEEVRTIIVSAPGFGSQQFGFGFRETSPGPKTVTLLPVGGVKGRLNGPPERIRHRRLTLMVWNPKSHPPPATALAYVTTDDLGRFTVPTIAEGILSVSEDGDITSPWYIPAQKDQKVKAGQIREIVVPLAKAVRIRGHVRERGTAKPIRGVRVSVGFDEATSATTDATGQFEGYSAPGQVYLSVHDIPEGYASLVYGIPEPQIPEGATEFLIPPIELSRAGVVRGLVVGPDRKPVTGAEVTASWQVNEGPGRQGRRELTVRSGPDGTFLVHDVTDGVVVELVARLHRLRTTQAASTRVGAEEPATLRIEDGGTMAMSGRVLAIDGHPLAGAQVHIRSQQHHPSGQVKGDELIEFEHGIVLTTGADGRFQTPKELDPDGEYAAYASAPGYRTDRTPWTAAKPGTFPDLTLSFQPRRGRIEREVQIRDREGRPVEEASAWFGEAPSARARSDAAGNARLDVPGRGRGFLFVEKEGFRFHGQVASPVGRPLTIVVTRLSEPPASRLVTLPPRLPRPEALALARRLIDPLVERFGQGDDPRKGPRGISVLAAIDPARALEIVEKGGFVDPQGFGSSHVRVQAARTLLGDDPEEAAAVLRTIADPARRARGWIDVLDLLPKSDRARKLSWLDLALTDARACQSPAERVLVVAAVAEHLLDLGEVPKATALLRETEPTARQLAADDRGDYARGTFAEELAQVDPDRALALVKNLRREGQTFPDRHHLNIAQELASRDPARAEAILRDLKPSFALSRSLPRICHAMAPKDLDCARNLLNLVDDPIDSFARPYALGMMALAIAKSDRVEAEKLLREAFVDLRRRGEEGRIGLNSQDVPTVAGTLVPVAESIDPGLVPEFLWRAVSFRKPEVNQDAVGPTHRAWFDAMLGLLVARYDRNAAGILIDPVASRFPLLMSEEFEASPLLWARAEIDPAAATAQVEHLPEHEKLKPDVFRTSREEALIAVASWLTSSTEEKWRRVTGLLKLWRVGGEDLY